MITLSSDFGSPYPAAMKGVLLQATDARLVDITHDFPRQDVRTAAFWLAEVLPYFPPAVHLVVVDPGVGTDREAVVVHAGEHALVGPDNGVLLPAARALSGEGRVDTVADSPVVFRLCDPTHAGSGDWPPDPDSATFHGRDVFAPAAARVHERGVGALATDPGLEDHDGYVDLRFPDPAAHESGATGEVLVVDGFGTAITNIPGDWLSDRVGTTVSVDGTEVPVRRSYAHVDPGTALVTVGSHGNVELAVNRGRGAAAFGVKAGSVVELGW